MKEKYKTKTGYFPVSDGYKLHYELYGNPKGIPIVFLHGGPGLGFSESDKRFFEEAKFRVLFFDQRGAGKSQPAGSLENNSTPNLVADILVLLDYFEIEKPILFGGSWGSTLAMLFAIQYPNRVKKMILRGFFPANQECVNHFEKGGSAIFFPEIWKEFLENIPKKEQKNPTPFFYKQLQTDDFEIQKKYAYQWNLYGSMLAKMNPDFEEIKKIKITKEMIEKLKIQFHYSVNNFFLSDNYIYENAHKIRNIPVTLIHGRYDMICPPIFAFRLKEQLKNAKLLMVNAGHIASEAAIERALKKELKYLNYIRN